MREIKFRAWDKKYSVMFRVSSVMFDGKSYISSAEDLGALHDGQNSGEYHRIPEEVELMQYTGLKDKNGVEIYEGDILHFTYWWFDGNEAEMPLTGEVVYVPEEASYGLAHIRSKEWLRHIGAQDTDEDTATFSGWQFSPDDIEVIGNIYENSELLTKLMERIESDEFNHTRSN